MKTRNSSNFPHRITLFGTLFLFVLLIFATPSKLLSQRSDGDVNLSNDIDTVQPAVEKEHSPKKATIYGLVLPGLGQAYNKKYWKIPIVYAGFGAVGYFISTNTKYYRLTRDAYVFASNDDGTGIAPNEYALKYSKEQLNSMQEYYHRNVEISYLALGAWYIITVLDADVDAHFFDYDVSEDLSLNLSPDIKPSVYPGSLSSSGVSLKLKF